nr:NADH dehydrogenase subunit 2 [Caryophyllaeus brachycollis]
MRVTGLSLGGFSVISSALFIFFSSCVDGLLGFWVFLELAGLAAVPAFFMTMTEGVAPAYGGLFHYVVMSALSSVCFVSGFIFDSLFYFIVYGFLIKLGVFPFMLWIYRVYSVSNWLFIFLLSVVLKYPVLYFCYILGGDMPLVLLLSCLVTVMLCGVGFWVWSNSWQFIWCHMSLSSVSTLLVACFCGDYFLCWFIFAYYVVWATACIYYFWGQSGGMNIENSVAQFCFLLLVTPLSLPLFYKLSVCAALFYSSVYFLFGWAVFSFSEQFFLYKLCGDKIRVGVSNYWVN